MVNDSNFLKSISSFGNISAPTLYIILPFSGREILKYFREGAGGTSFVSL